MLVGGKAGNLCCVGQPDDVAMGVERSWAWVSTIDNFGSMTNETAGDRCVLLEWSAMAAMHGGEGQTFARAEQCIVQGWLTKTVGDGCDTQIVGGVIAAVLHEWLTVDVCGGVVV